MVITAGGSVTRVAVADIAVQGRRTQGKRVVKVASGDRVVEVTRAAGSEPRRGPDEEASAPATGSSTNGASAGSSGGASGAAGRAGADAREGESGEEGEPDRGAEAGNGDGGPGGEGQLDLLGE